MRLSLCVVRFTAEVAERCNFYREIPALCTVIYPKDSCLTSCRSEITNQIEVAWFKKFKSTAIININNVYDFPSLEFGYEDVKHFPALQFFVKS